jgi:hypothetical protein
MLLPNHAKVHVCRHNVVLPATAVCHNNSCTALSCSGAKLRTISDMDASTLTGEGLAAGGLLGGGDGEGVVVGGGEGVGVTGGGAAPGLHAHHLLVTHSTKP